MTNDLEALARSLMSGKASPKIAKGLERLVTLGNTPEGKQILTMLSQSGSESVKTAAQAALSGDKDTAKQALMALFSTKEGAALAAKLMEVLTQ